MPAFAKTLEDALVAGFGDSGRQEIPLFSRAGNLVLQIFPNFFLGGMRKISALRAKKFGFIDSCDFAGRVAAMAPWVGGYSKRHLSMNPLFRKQFVAAGIGQFEFLVSTRSCQS
jgi:hypothetical protein